MTVSSRAAPTSRAVSHARTAPRAPSPRAPAVPHLQVRHELSKFAPTAPPNPTPAPQSSLVPKPLPTQAIIAVSPAPLPAQVPTSVPVAAVAAAIRVPATPVPSSAPRPAPTLAATPLPQPPVIRVTAAPVIAQATPLPVASLAPLAAVKIAAPRQPQMHAAAASPGPRSSPGPKPMGSPGPRAVGPAKRAALSRPVHPLTATPHPRPRSVASKRRATLNRRLHALIPTAAPAFTPAPPKRFSGLKIAFTPEPEPTPPASVLAATKFLYVENVEAQKWRESILGTTPEERYVKMYVTSVRHIGFITWCTGWVLRSPIAGRHKWIIEPDESFVCSGRLQPFTAPIPLPTGRP